MSCFMLILDIQKLYSVADVARLRAELPDLRAAHQLTFSHIDYLWGERAARELYHPLGDMLQQFIRP